MLGHLDEALTLAGTMSLALIAGRLAVVVTLAFIDAITFDFSFLVAATGQGRGRGKQGARQAGDRQLGKFSSRNHGYAPFTVDQGGLVSTGENESECCFAA